MVRIRESSKDFNDVSLEDFSFSGSILKYEFGSELSIQGEGNFLNSSLDIILFETLTRFLQEEVNYTILNFDSIVNYPVRKPELV